MGRAKGRQIINRNTRFHFSYLKDPVLILFAVTVYETLPFMNVEFDQVGFTGFRIKVLTLQLTTWSSHFVSKRNVQSFLAICPRLETYRMF